LYKHTSSLEIIAETATYLSGSGSLSKSNKKDLLLSQMDAGAYRGRNNSIPLDAATHRINTLRWIPFGYIAGSGSTKRFVFGPLGNLFLDNIKDRERLQYILLTLLWAKQFPDEFGTSKNFRVFPFRLIFKLMTDERLDFYLTGVEYAHIVSTIEEINEHSYNHLVQRIIEFRSLGISEHLAACEADVSHHVNGWHEWTYWRTLLSNAGLVVIGDAELDQTFPLNHGPSTVRHVDYRRSKISSAFMEFVNSLESEAPFHQKPLSFDEPGRLKSDVVKDSLSFLPRTLLKVLGIESESVFSKIAELLSTVSQVSLNVSKGDPDRFEELLTETMNTFVDVRAEWVGGSGMPDVSCVFTPIPENFLVEAKSTRKKLSSLNAGRLREHRKIEGAVYTVVITPAYTPAALSDIAGSEVAILTTTAFVEYLSNAARAGDGNYSYSDIRKIVIDGFGTDVSPRVSALTAEKYGVGV
jgi:type II restriction enzyme